MVNDVGIVTCLRDEHPLNATAPISETEQGISTSIKDEQYWKAPLSIFVTESGIEIFSNAIQLLKRKEEIHFNDEGFWKVTSLSDEHSWNANEPIETTEEGIWIWVREEQP